MLASWAPNDPSWFGYVELWLAGAAPGAVRDPLGCSSAKHAKSVGHQDNGEAPALLLPAAERSRLRYGGSLYLSPALAYEFPPAVTGEQHDQSDDGNRPIYDQAKGEDV